MLPSILQHSPLPGVLLFSTVLFVTGITAANDVCVMPLIIFWFLRSLCFNPALPFGSRLSFLPPSPGPWLSVTSLETFHVDEI